MVYRLADFSSQQTSNAFLRQIAYNRVARGLLHHDRLTFAVLLSRIFLRGSAEYAKLCSVVGFTN